MSPKKISGHDREMMIRKNTVSVKNMKLYKKMPVLVKV